MYIYSMLMFIVDKKKEISILCFAKNNKPKAKMINIKII